MLNLLGHYFALVRLTYFQAGMSFLHGEELSGGTIQYYDPEDGRVWFTDVESVALLGKALNYHEHVFILTELDDDILHKLLHQTPTVMDLYDNWRFEVQPW